MRKRTAGPIVLWAPIFIAKRGADSIIHSDIRHNRLAAKRAYLEGADPKYHAGLLKRIRFAKVLIMECEEQP